MNVIFGEIYPTDLAKDDYDLVVLLVGIAKSDNQLLKIEVRTIQSIFWAITGITLDEAETQKLVSVAKHDFDERQFKKMKRNLTDAKKTLVLKGLFDVMMVDQTLHEQELKYVHSVCRHLEISDELYNAVWTEMTNCSGCLK